MYMYVCMYIYIYIYVYIYIYIYNTYFISHRLSVSYTMNSTPTLRDDLSISSLLFLVGLTRYIYIYIYKKI